MGQASRETELTQFVGALEGVQGLKGYYFTTSSFSLGAKKYVESIKHDIVLVDGYMLVELISKYELENIINDIEAKA